ncbi:MAG: hypothetical protein J2P36_23450 [Ktedonobacteraceae bacterium]|nr:hypothetical protein [Ktedonobacteraceae bacterium]
MGTPHAPAGLPPCTHLWRHEQMGFPRASPPQQAAALPPATVRGRELPQQSSPTPMCAR